MTQDNKLYNFINGKQTEYFKLILKEVFEEQKGPGIFTKEQIRHLKSCRKLLEHEKHPFFSPWGECLIHMPYEACFLVGRGQNPRKYIGIIFSTFMCWILPLVLYIIWVSLSFPAYCPTFLPFWDSFFCCDFRLFFFFLLLLPGLSLCNLKLCPLPPFLFSSFVQWWN